MCARGDRSYRRKCARNRRCYRAEPISLSSRYSYGVVFDVPDEEVEQVYTIDQDRSMPMGPASPSQQK